MQSQDRQADACYGEGVYGTPLGPENGREKLAKNNYGEQWRTRKNDGKLDCVIRVKLRNDPKVRKVCDSSGREIYIYTGDLKINDTEEVDFIYFEQGVQKRKIWK